MITIIFDNMILLNVFCHMVFFFFFFIYFILVSNVVGKGRGQISSPSLFIISILDLASKWDLILEYPFQNKPNILRSVWIQLKTEN